MPAHVPEKAYKYCSLCGGDLGRRILRRGQPPRLICSVCGFVHYLDPKVAAGTIFLLDGGIVLLKRAIEPQSGLWVFPGGYVDRGETVTDAAVREAREETGLRISLLGVLNVYSYLSDPVVLIVYAGDVLGGKLAAGEECLEAKVFTPEQLPWEELAFDSTRAALRDYLRRYFPRVRLPR